MARAAQPILAVLALIPALLTWPVAAAYPTAAVERAVVSEHHVLDGVVEAVNRSTVSAQTSGRIAEVTVDVNDYVKRGRIIVRFKNTEQAASVRQAEGAVAEAEANLADARSEYQRTSDIFAKQLVAQSAMDKAESALKAAEARLDSAQAQLAAAREGLEHTVVRAPYSGIVVERHVEVGELASPGTPLMSGLSLEHLRVVTELPQRYADAVRRTGRAEILIDGREPVVAEKVTVFPVADPVSHALRTRIELPEIDLQLFPGMLVKVAVISGEREALLIPREAVVTRSEVQAVYVADDQGHQLRLVRLGPEQPEGRVEVLAGLQAGEQVVLDPLALITGAPAAPAPQAATDAAAVAADGAAASASDLAPTDEGQADE